MKRAAGSKGSVIVAGALEERFTAYVEALSGTLAHADRAQPFAAYCRGLILPGERKACPRA
jgi:SRSO17 transposase